VFIRCLADCEEIVAGDSTILREFLHPDKESLEITYSLAHARVKPGRSSLKHMLATTEVYYILEGRGTVHIDDESREVHAGHVVYIPPGAAQHIRNTGETDLTFLCIVEPAWREEDEQILQNDRHGA